MIEVFTACCDNERELHKEAKKIKRLFNNALRNNRVQEIQTLTKIYALVYSAYVEVSFLKTIHTPHGFDESIITQIQTARNLEEKWIKCIDFAFDGIRTEHNKGEISNKELKLRRIIETYIIGPSHVRNKIAHGQWKACLNSDCTGINYDLTTQMTQMDFVKIDILFNVYRLFVQCVEDLIEFPYRAHYRFFYSRIVALEEYIDETKDYSMESKLAILQSSPKHINRSRQLS